MLTKAPGGTWMSGIGAKKVSSQTGELFWSRQNGHKRRDNGEMDGNGAWKTRTCTKDGNVCFVCRRAIGQAPNITLWWSPEGSRPR